MGKDFIHKAAPLPWARTGPGEALDGKPKFDLTKFDPQYFERLRTHVAAAGQRGIYVSVMLFEGWGLMHGNRRRNTEDGWAWRSHPFNPANNINKLTIGGADALSGQVHTLGNRVVLLYGGFHRPHKYPRWGHMGQIGLACWKKERLAALVADEQGDFARRRYCCPAKRCT